MPNKQCLLFNIDLQCNFVYVRIMFRQSDNDQVRQLPPSAHQVSIFCSKNKKGPSRDSPFSSFIDFYIREIAFATAMKTTCIKKGLRRKSSKSYFLILTTKFWSEYKDSNLGPPGPKPGALPGCATLRRSSMIHTSSRYSNTNKKNNFPI